MLDDNWTGNAHLICDACGRHSRINMKMFADKFLCAVCMDVLMALIREGREGM